MQAKAGQKQIGLGLLICALFLAYGINILGTGNLVFSDLQAGNGSSASSGTKQSSMNGGNGLWHFNYQAITNISSELFLSSPKTSSWLLAKTFLLFKLIDRQSDNLSHRFVPAGRQPVLPVQFHRDNRISPQKKTA